MTCALMTVVLLLIQAGIGVPLAASKTFGLAGAMVALLGWTSTGIVAVIPAVTLIALFEQRGRIFRWRPARRRG